jgi:hypothetical protein
MGFSLSNEDIVLILTRYPSYYITEKKYITCFMGKIAIIKASTYINLFNLVNTLSILNIDYLNIFYLDNKSEDLVNFQINEKSKINYLHLNFNTFMDILKNISPSGRRSSFMD